MHPYQSQRNYPNDQIKNLCKEYMNYHVIGQMSDGSQIDGIIDSMDDESVTLLVPEEVEVGQIIRQYGYDYDNGYGYDYDDFDRPRRRRYRRFRRQRYPYGYLLRLLPYPYYYPPYPYYYPPYGY